MDAPDFDIAPVIWGRRIWGQRVAEFFSRHPHSAASGCRQATQIDDLARLGCRVTWMMGRDGLRWSGQEIRREMKASQVKIRELAAAMDVTQVRVRQIRKDGIIGPVSILDTRQGINEAAAKKT